MIMSFLVWPTGYDWHWVLYHWWSKIALQQHMQFFLFLLSMPKVKCVICDSSLLVDDGVLMLV